MAIHNIPEDLKFCFAPSWDAEIEMYRIHIVIDGLDGHIPTAMVSLELIEALSMCDRFNLVLGLDREAWTGMAAGFMLDEPRGRHLH